MKTFKTWVLILSSLSPAERLWAAPVSVQWPGVSAAEGHWVYHASFSLVGFTPAQAAVLPSVTRYFVESVPSAPYSLGPLPAGLAINWPAPAVTTASVVVTDPAQLGRTVSWSGVLIRVQTDVPNLVLLTGDDVELRVEGNAKIDFLEIRGRRVAVRGGRFESISIDRAEDVLIDGVSADAPDDSAIAAHGRRVAILNCRTTAMDYGVYAGVSGYMVEDLIVANNRFISTPPLGGNVQATFIFFGDGVRRSVAVENVLVNAPGGLIPFYQDEVAGEFIKPNYRVHGGSRQNFFARNVLVNSGFGGGYNAGDAVGDQWFVDNVVYHTERLIQVGLSGFQGAVNLTGNRAYSDSETSFIGNPPPGWNVARNRIFPYELPPANLPGIRGRVSAGTLIYDTDLPSGVAWYFRRTEVAGGVESGFLDAELVRTPFSNSDNQFPSAPRGFRRR